MNGAPVLDRAREDLVEEMRLSELDGPCDGGSLRRGTSSQLRNSKITSSREKLFSRLFS